MTDALALRYGDPDALLGVTSDVLAQQLAHRSVRSFLPDPVADDVLDAVVTAAQSAATSSNLQPWSVVAVRDAGRRRRLAALAGHQEFIARAPLLLAWVVDLGRARRIAASAGSSVDAADYLETTVIGFVDTALAAQNALLAAESLGLGGVFVGALRNRPVDVAAELGLPDHTIAAFGLALGHPDPTERADIKPRLPRTAVLHHEQYDADRADREIAAYDARLGAYNERFGLAGRWTDRVLARLAGPQAMAGRHELRAHLEARGLPSR